MPVGLRPGRVRSNAIGALPRWYRLREGPNIVYRNILTASNNINNYYSEDAFASTKPDFIYFFGTINRNLR